MNVKPNGITLQGFLDEPAMLHSVKGNETKVVKAYAFLRNKEENSSGHRESNKTRVLYDFVALIWAKLKV